MSLTTVKILQKTHSYPGLGTDGERIGDYVFVKDPVCRKYDWLVVFDEMRGNEELACPRERTIFATWEPVSIKSYTKSFVRQFGHLLTNRPPEAEGHPHTHLGRGYFHWFIGRSYAANRDMVIPPKSETISMVCSAKKMRHTRHMERFRLATEIARDVPGVDWFGAGVRSILCKADALDPYRYTVAIENHIAPHHWSEKLSDALLAECLPFYAGDPAIGEVLPPESLIPIPIDDPQEAVRIIRAAIVSDEYSRRRDAVREAKRLILEKYNFWMQVIEVIESAKTQRVTPVDPAHPEVIYSRHALRLRSPSAAFEALWSHLKGGF